MNFNTGNNVPSTDPRDLYDNAENLDKLVNGADPFYADRLGKLRESWAGMENSFNNAQEGRETAFTLSQADKESRFQAFLVSSGYVSKGDYAADVVLAERNEYVAVDAATTGTTAGLYRPGPGATLPLTLTGTWATDSAGLVLLGDDVLRQELAGPDGASNVGARMPSGEPGTVRARLDRNVVVFATPSDISAANISPTITSIRTVAASIGGLGGQIFKRYEGESVVDGYFIVQSADGAKWKGQEKPAPKHFGAIDGTDLSEGLQRWANYVASHDEPASWECTGYVTRKITAAVAEGSTAYSRKIEGKIRLTATMVSVECLLEFNGFIQSSWGDGEYIGEQVWSQRTVDYAFRFIGCKYMAAGNFYIWGCRRFGIDLGYYTTEFKFQSVNALYCGCCKYQKYPFDYQSTFRYGSGADQRSTIQSAGALDPVLRPGDGFIVNGHYYHIRLVDHAGGNFRIFPWLTDIDAAALESDPANNSRIVLGGGLRHGGGETNAGYIARFSDLVCGHGIQADELYPVSIGKYATQLSDVGLRIGLDYQNAYRGGSIGDAYVEACAIFIVELASGGESPYSVMQWGQYTPELGFEHPAIVPESFVRDPFASRSFIRTPSTLQTVAVYGDTAPIVTTAGGNTPVTTVVAGSGLTTAVKLSVDRACMDAHGRFALQLNIVGPNSTAPGQVTFTADAGDMVMSNASYERKFLAAAIVVAVFKNGNWALSIFSAE